MVLGSAKAWRTKIVMKAKRLSEIPVFKKMSDEGKKVMTKAVRKFWQIA
jgi:hypothetical protein